jgi:protein-disulfide isomerase
MSVLRTPVSSRDHSKGPTSAMITIVEYADFQCPYCGQQYAVLQELAARFTTDLRIVYRHFPLTEIHAYAMIAAETAEAAGAQGMFWQMHDLLYRNQPRFDPDGLLEYAEALDVDLDQMARDLETSRHRDRIRDDVLGGVQSGVNGTPTLFINGDRYDGTLELAALTRFLERVVQVPERQSG